MEDDLRCPNCAGLKLIGQLLCTDCEAEGVELEEEIERWELPEYDHDRYMKVKILDKD